MKNIIYLSILIVAFLASANAQDFPIKINHFLQPFTFLSKPEVNMYKSSILNSIEKIRFNIDLDFQRLESETRAETSLNNKLLSSSLDKFFSQISEMAENLRQTRSIDIEVEGIKQILLSEAKQFDFNVQSELISQRRVILNNLINFYLNDFMLLFKVQSNFLHASSLEQKVSVQYEQLVKNLLSEHVKTASNLNSILGKKMDFIINSVQNLKSYLGISFNLALNNPIEYASTEIYANELFSELISKIQKLKVVNSMNVNSMLAKSYERNSRIVNLEVIILKYSAFGRTGIREPNNNSNLASDSFANEVTNTNNNKENSENVLENSSQPKLEEQQSAQVNASDKPVFEVEEKVETDEKQENNENKVDEKKVDNEKSLNLEKNDETLIAIKENNNNKEEVVDKEKEDSSSNREAVLELSHRESNLPSHFTKKEQVENQSEDELENHREDQVENFDEHENQEPTNFVNLAETHDNSEHDEAHEDAHEDDESSHPLNFTNFKNADSDHNEQETENLQEEHDHEDLNYRNNNHFEDIHDDPYGSEVEDEDAKKK